MRRWQQWTMAISVIVIGIYSSGCGSIGSISKAPINKLAVGGTKKERNQQFMLRRLKWEHRGASGIVTGLSHFTDGRRPIAGAREKDTLFIHQGPYKGSYGIKKVLRLVDTDRRGKRRRRVIIKINGQFFDQSQPKYWKTLSQGGQGITLAGNVFTDPKSFLPEVPIGTQLLLQTGGQQKTFTVVGNRADKFGLKGLQRIGYILREKLPKGLENLTYKVRSPNPNVSNKLSYHIHWKGSGLTGHNFTLGINRRRYGQKEVEDLLRSDRVIEHLNTIGKELKIEAQVKAAIAETNKELVGGSKKDVKKNRKWFSRFFFKLKAAVGSTKAAAVKVKYALYPSSRRELGSVGAKRSAAIVMQVLGGVAAVLGGFLALVRRDDFPGAQQAIPWSIAGGGVVLLLSSIPLNVSANNDFLRAAQAYNKDVVKQLQINPKDVAQKTKKPEANPKRLVSPGPTPSQTPSVRR